MKVLTYSNLGLIDYEHAWNLQKKLHQLRKENLIDDTLLLLEHPHTYTLGKLAKKEHLLGNSSFLQEKGITVFEIDRGGDITYHGPGQIVGYPIIDLKQWKQDSHKYLRGLEEVIIMTLDEYGLKGERNEKYTGVWLNDKKITAIGIKISSWVTMHGFAFNINTDLNYFNWIVPCGITDKKVTSLNIETGVDIVEIEVVKDKLVKYFIDYFEYSSYKIENKLFE